MLDLYHATRDELIRIILDLRTTIADQERQLAAVTADQADLRAVLATVTAQLGTTTAPDGDDAPPGTPKGMPGLKPTQAPVQEPRPRKRRAKGYGRQRMQATTQVVHALATCPDCGAPLAGGSVKRTREVLDLPPPRIVVTAHVYLERRCPDCGTRCVPPPDLGAVVSGQGRLGHGLRSLLAVLREEARLPVAMIQRLLATLTGLHLSVGAIVDSVAQVADRAQPVVAQLAETIRASPVVHADETGWREAGRNGYVWTFSTPDIRLYRHGRRTKDMVSTVLGETFGGVLVSDFYAAYTGYEGVHQYCWAHLFRDIHELTTQHPDDPAVQGWAAAVGAVFSTAQTEAAGDRAARWPVRNAAEASLRQLCTPWLEPKVAHTPLCARILKHLESLFVFVTEPAVPATNNAAERSLRPLVVSRKISGGTRSAAGTRAKMTLASLFGTWRAQGINPYDACRDLLASPQI
jgi:transposase